MPPNCILQGVIYHFRRRVPDVLRTRLKCGVIVRSLDTSCHREAAVRSRALYLATERLFRTVIDNPVLPTDDIKTLMVQWIGRQAWAIAYAGQPEVLVAVRTSIAIADQRGEVTSDSAELAARFAASAGVDPARPDLPVLMQGAVADYADGITGRSSAFPVAAVASTAPDGKPSAGIAKKVPLFSMHEKAFLTWKQTQKGWTPQSGAQAEATYRLLRELVGDKPVTAYSREDAGRLYDDLLRLPSSHGKGAAKGKGLPAREAIARADAKEAAGTPVPRVQLKTVKRHFSALLQYWKWLKPRGHVGDDLIWSGFEFPGTKSSKRKRDVWGAEELERLFGSNWWAPDAVRDTARWWVPLIALHSGMRLEEICRLRPTDVVLVHDVMCFDICTHLDGWSPKTEAGERMVPVHPFLIDLGFLDLVERRRREGAVRVFSELRPTGRDGKLGQALGRDFGRLKTGLGVGPKTVFHSFRHTFRTVLESADLEERWIDAVMGHEDPTRSEGGRTYAKSVTVERLAEVVAAFGGLVSLEHLRRQ